MKPITKYTREFDLQKKKATDLREVIESDKIINKKMNFKSISARRTVSNSDTNNTLSILSSEYYKNIEENESQQQVIEDFKDVIGHSDISTTEQCYIISTEVEKKRKKMAVAF